MSCVCDCLVAVCCLVGVCWLSLVMHNWLLVWLLFDRCCWLSFVVSRVVFFVCVVFCSSSCVYLVACCLLFACSCLL